MALTGEQWQRITQVHELVKQEGDARCEAAFDDLLAEHHLLRKTLETIEYWCRADVANPPYMIVGRIRKHVERALKPGPVTPEPR